MGTIDMTAAGVVLLVDDDLVAKQIETSLERSVPGVAVVRAQTRERLVELLGSRVDVVVSDGDTAGCEGVLAFHLARQSDPRISCVMLPGTADIPVDEAGLHALGVTRVSPSDLNTIGVIVTDVLLGRLADDDAHPDRVGGYQLLVSTVRQLSLAPDFKAVMATVRSAARRLTGADGATFVLRDGDHCYYADEDAIGPLWKGSRFPLEQCVSGWAMMNRHPAVIPDIYADPRVPIEAYEPTFVRSLVMVPIRAVDPVGAIGTYWANTRRATPSDVRLLQALADSTAVALENVRVQQDLERRVAERTEDLEAFMYAVSHDLRAPIRHISGYAAMVLDGLGPDVDASSRATLTRLTQSADHLRDMVDGLLELSRTIRGEVRRVGFDLALLARRVAEECRREHDHPVDFRAPDDLWVSADPTLLRTVLQNLLGNAWKFTSATEGARVELGVETDSGPTPVYYIQDNGAGFDPAQAGRLFGVFQRLHGQDAFPGTGVGLASVRRIVQRHRGSVEATAIPGAGARFSFTLGDTVGALAVDTYAIG
jgi:signal transduction histidine kinase